MATEPCCAPCGQGLACASHDHDELAPHEPGARAVIVGDLAAELERLKKTLRFGAMDRRTPVNPDGRSWSDWDRMVGNDRRFYAAQQRAELQQRVAQLEQQVMAERAALEQQTIAARQRLEQETIAARQRAEREGAARARAAAAARPAAPRRLNLQLPALGARRAASAPRPLPAPSPDDDAAAVYIREQLAALTPDELEQLGTQLGTATPEQLEQLTAALTPPDGWRPSGVSVAGGIPSEVRAVDDVISSIWGAVRGFVPYGNIIDQAHNARRTAMYGAGAGSPPARKPLPSGAGAGSPPARKPLPSGNPAADGFRSEAQRLQDLTRRAAKGETRAKAELSALRASAPRDARARRTWNAATAILRDDLARIASGGRR